MPQSALATDPATELPEVLTTITFSEQPRGTTNPTFTFDDNTITTVGEIVNDGAQPDSPVIAANSSYRGPVFLYFENPVNYVSGSLTSAISTTSAAPASNFAMRRAVLFMSPPIPDWVF